MERVSSAITGVLAAVTQPNSDGTSLGKTGSGNSLTVSESATRDWLLKHDPVEVDRLLLTSLRSSLNVEVMFESRITYPEGGGFKSEIAEAKVRAPDGNFSAALVKVEASMTRPTIEQVEEWISLIEEATAPRRRSEAGIAVAMTFFASSLSRFPADIVRSVCEQAAKGKWFPTLGELLDRCESLSAKRSRLAEKLRFLAYKS